MKISITDIARLSGVGISTVSRVINNSGYVSDKTREKVTSVIEAYNYQTTTLNNRLENHAQPNIGVFVKGIGNPFFEKMINEFDNDFMLRGYTARFYDVLHRDEFLVAQVELSAGRIEGAVILGSNKIYSEKQIKSLAGPLVSLTVKTNKTQDLTKYGSVVINDELEGYKATKILLDAGHEKIGFIYADSLVSDTPNQARYRGYRQALEEYGIPLDLNLVAGSGETDSTYATQTNGYKLGLRMMNELMQMNPDMTAVFCYSDILAIGAAKAALMSGKSIPEDISIIGFDGIDESEIFHPSLDTIYQPTREMSRAAVSMIIDLVNGEEGKQLEFACTYMKRGSVAQRRNGEANNE